MGEEHMENLGASLREWISKQTVAGLTFEWPDIFHAHIVCKGLGAHITYLPFLDQKEVVEFRIQRSDIAKPSFITHFVLDDIWHAKAIFREMATAFETELKRGATSVLVCYSASDDDKKTAEALVKKLREEERALPIAFSFKAIPVSEALEGMDGHAAFMLTPAASQQQQSVHEANPQAAVFALPLRMAESNDGRRAFRLLLEALGEIDTLAPEVPPVHPAHALYPDKRVLLINVMYCDRCVRMGWCVYQGLEKVAIGKVTKSTLAMADIFDLVDTLFLYGIPHQTICAIGLLVPGVVNFCSMNLPSLGDRDQCVKEKIEARYGIPVLVENNTNAAAMGSYILQNDYESISVYRHQLGHLHGGQGTVIGGQVVAGRYGMAGEPKFYQKRFQYDLPYNQMVWTEKGLKAICKNVVLATIGTIEPDAVYIAVNTMQDMDDLRASLERALPKYCVPDLYFIEDYRERMYLGGAKLCLKMLAK